MRITRGAHRLAILLMVLACGQGATDTPGATVTGTWVVNAPSLPGNLAVDCHLDSVVVVLNRNGASLSGRFDTLRFTCGGIAPAGNFGSVEGEMTAGRFLFWLERRGFDFDGSIANGRMSGTLTYSVVTSGGTSYVMRGAFAGTKR